MHTDVAAVLIDIEAELRQIGYWDDVAPTEEALASDQPFAVDTLSLPQWLQFIFLPTMYALVESEATLPEKCGITPMAEEFFRGREESAIGLIEALDAIDKLLSGDATPYATSTNAKN